MGRHLKSEGAFVVLSVRVPRDLVKDINEIVSEKGYLDRSDFIREVLSKEVEKCKKLKEIL